MSKQLPDRPNLDHLRKQAKDLLSAFKKKDRQAIERFHSLPSFASLSSDQIVGKTLALHDAQSVIAREYGFDSWTKLVTHVEEIRAKEGITPEIIDKFMRIAAGEGQGSLERMLQLYPSLPKQNIQTACAYGDPDYIRNWLKDHSVDEKLEPMGWRPLEYVCYSSISRILPDRYEPQLECAQILLDAGADPNTNHNWNDQENAPLPVLYGACCHAQHEGIARLLLQRGAKTNDGESIYHSAQLDLTNMLELLKEFGADFSQDDPNWRNTPLYFNAGHRPSDSGYEKAMLGCEWLLDHGANPNVKSYDCQETPLFPAVRAGNARLVHALIAHGADVNVKNDKGLTPYILAAVTGAADVMDILAAAGADTTLPDPGPFLADCAAGRIDKVKEALRKDPDIVNRLTDHERKVLCKMAELGRTVGVRTCLDAGFPIDTRGEENATPLHFACYCQWDETASLLIERGAPLEVRDATYDGTPLAWVLEGYLYNRNAKGDGIKIVKQLLAAGASDENLRQRLETDDAENPAMLELLKALDR